MSLKNATRTLDNPIWESLGSGHLRFAQSAGWARRFTPAVSPLAGLREMTQQGFDSLATLVSPGETAGLFLENPAVPVSGWTLNFQTPLLQMLHDGTPIAAPAQDYLELGAADAQDMVALATLTMPGPFNLRTRELGTYIGLRDGGRLIAMTGERLRLPGHTEVSAVCTHPDHLGRGHARALMAEAANRMIARGERPFLHVRLDNARAIALYERIGFSKRVILHYAFYRRDAE